MREEAFHPSLKTNQDTTNLVVELNKTLATAILEEFKTHKTGKVAWRYISEWNGYISLAVFATEARDLDLGKEKMCGYGIMVVNDVCESHLATTTANLNSTKNIAAAAADGDAQRQHFFDRKLSGTLPGTKEGPFFQWCQAIRFAMICAAITVSPSMREQNWCDIARQDAE